MYKIILGSSSPRRSELLKIIINDFEIRKSDSDETYSEKTPEKIAQEISMGKAGNIKINENELLITADTIVVIEGLILGKPKDEKQAFDFLRKLSGKRHEVITGLTLKTTEKSTTFSEKTYVYFKNISDENIGFYIKNFKPFDKAGSYGVQDYGATFAERIDGDFFNVMGLPVSRLYYELGTFIGGNINEYTAKGKST